MQRILLECAVRAALMAGGTAAVLGVMRVKSAAARHVAWTAVVVMMLTLPVWTVWGPKAPLHVLPAAAARRSDVMAGETAGLEMDGGMAAEVRVTTARASSWNWWTWGAGVYLLGVGALMTRLAIGTVRAHLLVRNAAEHEGRLTSSWCAAPVTVGWLRPAVILPECWREWPQAQLDAVMTHEGEHARRRDPLVEWLALLNRAVFWFHPLAWWLERRINGLAEEACDAAVLARGHDPLAYAECLVEMARLVSWVGARVDVWGMAMPGSALPQRLRRILEGRAAPRMTKVRAACAAVGCALVFAMFAAGAVDRRQPEAAAAAGPARAIAAPPAVAAQSSRPVVRRKALTAQARTTPAPDPAAPQKRLVAMYLDMAAIPDAEKAVAAAQTMIQARMQADDLLGVLVYRGGKVAVRQDFTGDRDLVLRTIRQAIAEAPAESRNSSIDEQLDGLRMAAEMLGPLPGYKSVVFFNGGAMPGLSSHQEHMQAAIDAAVRAKVAFYLINAEAPQR